MSLANLKETRRESITVGFFFERNKNRLKMVAVNGEVGFEKVIRDKSIHRPGLALAGYVELFTFDRVQIVGNTEVRYLKHLSLVERVKSFETLFKFDIPCVVISGENTLDDELIAIATRHGVSVFKTPLETTKLVYFVSDFLDDQFSPQTVIHGSFIDVYGIGVLLVGRSGIGKSEVALDLIERGHRLVADDVIMVTRKGEGILIGAGTDVVKHFMEIRGLGLIDVRSIFGIRSIRFQKRAEIVVELQEWSGDVEYTRTGLDHENISILGVEIPHVKLPIFPGKNITVIVEVIALDYLLRHYGYDAAREFSKRLDAAIAEKSKSKRAIDYFEHDFE
ncbi:MAG TPA: HPr kinase/phosphorylase [Bacteroidetes bacterium]|nr:MAG: HPr(Ser) kinase/phosphatase [Ignavibacteria bacterium GWA2_54_16]HCA81049.1 HPr kinase/phosphorylase [Bacteroidota bacterium]